MGLQNDSTVDEKPFKNCHTGQSVIDLFRRAPPIVLPES